MCFDTLFYLIDEYLKNSFHKEDKQVTMSDSEIIFAYLVSFQYFSGNYFKTLFFLKQSKLMSKILSSSRFSRRLNRLKNKIEEITGLLFEIAKSKSDREFCIDSFPLEVCKLVRIKRCKLVHGKEYLGFNSSKDEYYYGFKIHLVVSRAGGIVEFGVTPASKHDGIAFKIFNFDLPKKSKVYGDKAFNNYLEEELLLDCANVDFLPVRKSNSKKPDNTVSSNYIRKSKRKIIESFIGNIQGLFPKKIHSTNIDGFLLKIVGFILSYNFFNIFA